MAIADTGITINDNPRVDLRLCVAPDGGGPEFDATVRLTVSRLAVPQVGQRLAVRYDPNDPSRIVAVPT